MLWSLLICIKFTYLITNWKYQIKNDKIRKSVVLQFDSVSVHAIIETFWFDRSGSLVVCDPWRFKAVQLVCVQDEFHERSQGFKGFL